MENLDHAKGTLLIAIIGFCYYLFYYTCRICRFDTIRWSRYYYQIPSPSEQVSCNDSASRPAAKHDIVLHVCTTPQRRIAHVYFNGNSSVSYSRLFLLDLISALEKTTIINLCTREMKHVYFLFSSGLNFCAFANTQKLNPHKENHLYGICNHSIAYVKNY